MFGKSARLVPAALLFLLHHTTTHAELVLTAPPRESETKAREVFDPIAAHLTQVLGEKVGFRFSDNWLTYQNEMRKGTYDIVFDGPHFVSWRMARLDHLPVVKLPGELRYVIIVRRDESRIYELNQIIGRRLCAPAAPNLASQVAAYQFSNPTRQPVTINTKGFPQAYQALLEKKCDAAALQQGIYKRLEKEHGGDKTRVIFTSAALPNQAFTISPRVKEPMRSQIANAFLSDSGKAATQKLRQEYNGQDFVRADRDEYRDAAVLLKDVWGFELN